MPKYSSKNGALSQFKNAKTMARAATASMSQDTRIRNLARNLMISAPVADRNESALPGGLRAASTSSIGTELIHGAQRAGLKVRRLVIRCRQCRSNLPDTSTLSQRGGNAGLLSPNGATPPVR